MKVMKTIMVLVIGITLMGCQETTNLDHSVKLIPENYYENAEQQGSVVKMEYQTKLYDTDELITKYCYVYLPYAPSFDIRNLVKFHLMSLCFFILLLMSLNTIAANFPTMPLLSSTGACAFR